MIVLLTLLRKHLVESRWVLGISSAAFFGIAYWTTYLAQKFEKLIAEGEIGPGIKRYGFLRGLGGEAMDYSTTALEVCWWNHPVVVLTVLAWAVGRGSAAVAGEIERGTIDLTLSRPIARWAYLASQVLFAVLGLLIMVALLVAGLMVGNLIYTLKTPPTLLTLLKPATMVVTLGMAVFGYTLPFSSLDVVRWRATVTGAALTLAGLVALSFAPWFEDTWYHDWLQRLSVFQAYAPVTVALKGDPLAYNATALLMVFLTGVAVSFWLFLKRDIPSNS